MLTPSERALRLVRKPGAVEDACRFAELATSSCDGACREAVTLAATELAENLLKYCERTRGTFAGTLGILLDDKQVCIKSQNAVLADGDAEHVVALVSRIRATPGGARHLYRERLRELFEAPQLPRAQLGLLRLAYEGGFELKATFERPMLEVAAIRPAQGAE
jgi:hypothetical protein